MKNDLQVDPLVVGLYAAHTFLGRGSWCKQRDKVDEDAILHVRVIVYSTGKGKVGPDKEVHVLVQFALMRSGRQIHGRLQMGGQTQVSTMGWTKLLFKIHQWKTVDCDAVSNTRDLGPTAQAWLLPDTRDHKSSRRGNGK